MAEYREDTVRHDRRTGGAGRIVLIVALVAAIIAGLLFATGFWTADVKEGSLPDVDVSAKGGDLPDVNVDSKKSSSAPRRKPLMCLQSASRMTATSKSVSAQVFMREADASRFSVWANEADANDRSSVSLAVPGRHRSASHGGAPGGTAG